MSDCDLDLPGPRARDRLRLGGRSGHRRSRRVSEASM